MKRVILFLKLILTGWDCSSQPSDIYIKNKKHYDQIFIEGLSRFKGPIRLIDNFIIAEGGTTYFTEVLKIKKEIKFSGKKTSALSKSAG